MITKYWQKQLTKEFSQYYLRLYTLIKQASLQVNSLAENVRLLNGAEKLPGILLFIDFRKASDTTEWNFIHKCIELYNFGQNIRKWISFLYNNVESGVMNAGFMTNYFKVSWGVRQAVSSESSFVCVTKPTLQMNIGKSYIWTAEKDMNLWLIIAVTLTT